VRLEAAMCKLWATERCWEHVNETMQIRGGRGYETAQSLAARGEPAVPVERLLRDSRINTIFEGSSEIMRLFIAREALDPHLKIGAPMLDTRLPMKARIEAGKRATWRYARWYPRQWLGPFADIGLLFSDLSPRLAAHVRWTARTSHRLARALFHAMALHGPKLEREQMLLGRFVDLGTELFAIATTCSRAHFLGTPEALELADFFAHAARLKIERLFHSLHHHTDRAGYRLAQQVLAGRYDWLNEGILR
jgi:alkylation response protein AidB-like acyl-CoA dehydrogenase